MKYSKEFTELIKEKVQSSLYVTDLVSIEEMYWDKHQNGVFVRTIALQKDDSHCGHGIGIYFNKSKGNFTLLADGKRSSAPFDIVFKEIKSVLPYQGDFFSLTGEVVDYQDRLESEIQAREEADEKIKYLEAKLFIHEYEAKQKAKNNKLPF